MLVKASPSQAWLRRCMFAYHNRTACLHTLAQAHTSFSLHCHWEWDVRRRHVELFFLLLATMCRCGYSICRGTDDLFFHEQYARDTVSPALWQMVMFQRHTDTRINRYTHACDCPFCKNPSHVWHFMVCTTLTHLSQQTDFDCRFFALILFAGSGIRRWKFKIREQFAPLFISQPRNQNQSIHASSTSTSTYFC